MKKLLEETTDELTRALLVAGSSHRPPPGNKAKLLVSLGVGTSVGLLSSKAFAWLSTSAGKASVISVVGLAGALYVAAPLFSSPQQEPPRATPDNEQPVATEVAPAVSAPQDAPRTVFMPLAPAARGEPASVVPGSDSVAAPAATRVPRARMPATEANVEQPARRSARAKRTREQEALPVQGSVQGSAAQLPPEAPPEASAPVAAVAVDRSRLEAEVQLVDDMHWAARRNDREALGRFVASYRLQFPDGQLRQEVAEFAERLERPDAR